MDKLASDGGGGLGCSFCGKAAQHAKALIAGPSVYICDECVELCNDIVGDHGGATTTPSSYDSIPVPRHELTGAVRVLNQAVGAIGSANVAVADEAARLAGRLSRYLQEGTGPGKDGPPSGAGPETAG